MHVQTTLAPWLWPVLVLAAVGLWLLARALYRQTVPAATPAVARALVALRTAAFALLLLALVQPVLLRLLPRSERAVVAVVVEDSASETLADCPAPGGTTRSRWDAAWSLAATLDSTLARREDPPLVVYLRGNGLRPAVFSDPTDALAREPRAVGTDLPQLVAQAEQQLLGRPLRALVVLSDGNETAGAGADAAPATASLGMTPTWLVGLGDPVGPADRRLTDLRYPQTAFRGEAVTVDVTVADRYRDAAPGTDSLTVQLLRGDQVLASLRRSAADDLQRVALTFTPEDVGLQVLTLKVSPLANERFLANNEATLVVDVRKDRAHLLLLTSSPDWDARFLAQAATLEPRLQLSVVYPGLHGPVLADSLTAWTAPTTASGWQRYDGVILDGLPGALLPDQGRSLAAAVGAGVGLWAIAEAADARAAAWPAPLADLLPVIPRSSGLQPGSYFVRAAAAAPRHPVLAGVSYDVAAGMSLASLPPLRALAPVTLKPQAEVLLEATTGQDDATGRPLLVLGDPQHGRTVWFGGRRLWELAFWEQASDADPTAAQPMRQLLRNLMLWTAFGAQEGGIALLGHKVAYQEGEAIHVEAQWLDLRGLPVAGRPVNLQVDSDGATAQPPRTFAMSEELDRPGVRSVDLPPLPPGRYRLVPRAGDDAAVAGQARPLVVTPATIEQTQIRQDRRELRQLAARLGARALDGGEASDRAQLLRDIGELDLRPQPRQLRQRWEIWASWPYLALVVALLGIEWLVRRRQGML